MSLFSQMILRSFHSGSSTIGMAGGRRLRDGDVIVRRLELVQNELSRDLPRISLFRS